MKFMNIEIKKLQYIYEGFLSSLASLIVIASVIFYSLYDFVDNTNLTIWYIINIFLLTLRGLLFLQYKRTTFKQENYAYFYWSFFILLTLTALL